MVRPVLFHALCLAASGIRGWREKGDVWDEEVLQFRKMDRISYTQDPVYSKNLLFS